MRKHIKPQQRPVFCLQYLDRDFCLSKCDKEEKAAFADTLHQLSQRDWVELKFANKHGSGSEKIPRNIIRGRIPSVATDDVTFLAFRFHENKAMVGFRVGRILHLVWLDRAFSLYPHG